MEGSLVKSIGAILEDMGWSQRLRDLATGIRSNVPRSGNPEAFHERKSELENQAVTLADEIERHLRNETGGVR